MRIDQTTNTGGFTLVEVLVALVVCVVFSAAAFATNSKLLSGLKNQKETTAATMLLQRRMEELRASAWRDVATASYLKNTIVANPTNPTAIQNSEAPLGDLTERITVSVYPPDNATSAVVQRDSLNPAGQIVSYISNNPAETSATVYSYLTGPPKNASLLRVDILLSWKGAGARAALRSRQLSSIFGIGNIAP